MTLTYTVTHEKMVGKYNNKKFQKIALVTCAPG